MSGQLGPLKVELFSFSYFLKVISKDKKKSYESNRFEKKVSPNTFLCCPNAYCSSCRFISPIRRLVRACTLPCYWYGVHNHTHLDSIVSQSPCVATSLLIMREHISQWHWHVSSRKANHYPFLMSFHNLSYLQTNHMSLICR